jgi:exonuclease III
VVFTGREKPDILCIQETKLQESFVPKYKGILR